ncbi:MAG: hypothetical protein ACFFCE_14290 [Promethearchaeota archaeon]
MKKTHYLVGMFFFGILLFSACFGMNIAYADEDEDEEGEHCKEEVPCEEEQKDEKGEDPKDTDDDGVDDDFEEKNKRYVEIWFGEGVVEIASIKRSDDQKDIMDLRIGYSDCGLDIRVSFRTIRKVNCEEEPVQDEGESGLKAANGDDVENTCEEWIHELKLNFDVKFPALIEYVDLNDNGIFEHENNTAIEHYWINSFQEILYDQINISDDSVLHYFLVNTTDGVFTAHIYFPEEFIILDGNIVAPTQIKIDIEITDYDYIEEDSQLALLASLLSENPYKEKEETEDEKAGKAINEKEVFIDNKGYKGIFSWKETAMIDGVEMPVLTNELELEKEDDDIQRLFFNYPRGTHIYHDPKIGIVLEEPSNSEFPMIIIGPIAGVAGLSVIALGVFISKKKIR